MRTIAVLPVKSFGRAKQRLTGGFPDRPGLAAAMVADVLDALARVPELDQVIVVTAQAVSADTQHTVAEAYGAWGEKSLYGRQYLGIIRSTFLIDGTCKVAAVWPKVKVKGHVEEVQEALKAL